MPDSRTAKPVSPPAAVSAPPDAFAFGRNWQRYVSRYMTPERERAASDSMRDLLELDLTGLTFLDIGAGSGLFSLCAHRMGAGRVISVDVDPDAVDSCRALRQAAGGPSTWEVIEGSILDPKLVAGLEAADVLYSWGVLHHTGDMYTAIANAAQLVKPGGVVGMGIYNRASGPFLDSERWLRIKRAYNHSPRVVQIVLERLYGADWVLKQLRHRRNPLTVARQRRTRRMAVWTDLVDWLGGYPYEFARAHEIVSFCEGRCGLTAKKVLAVPDWSPSNNQFVFERLTARAEGEQ